MAASLAKENPGPLVLIGFSMGGFVARRIARLCPDRTVALILINSSARGDTPERRDRNRIARASQEGRSYKGLSRLALARALHPDLEQNTALIDRPVFGIFEGGSGHRLTPWATESFGGLSQGPTCADNRPDHFEPWPSKVYPGPLSVSERGTYFPSSESRCSGRGCHHQFQPIY